MRKKIHCKHGLEKKEEIQARRMRGKLESGDEELVNKVRELYKIWFKKPTMSFLDWLIKLEQEKEESQESSQEGEINTRSLSSALRRLDDWTKLVV